MWTYRISNNGGTLNLYKDGRIFSGVSAVQTTGQIGTKLPKIDKFLQHFEKYPDFAETARNIKADYEELQRNTIQPPEHVYTYVMEPSSSDIGESGSLVGFEGASGSLEEE